MARYTHQEQLYVTWDSYILVPHNLICVSWWKLNARLRVPFQDMKFTICDLLVCKINLTKDVQSSVTKGLCCLFFFFLLLEQHEDYLLCT